MGSHKTQVEEAFPEYYKVAPVTQCWMWTGPLNALGYPIYASKVAYRYAYRLDGRQLPRGKLHRICEERLCVNPNHYTPKFSDEWFHSAYTVADNGCWLWKYSTDDCGYGGTGVGKGKRQSAHRLFYERFVGKIPAYRHLDHKCHTPACVNPDHLRLATPQQNSLHRRKPKGKLYIGVTDKTKYVSKVILPGVGPIHLGTYRFPEEAAWAYDVAVTLTHGEFGVLNFPDKRSGLPRNRHAHIRNVVTQLVEEKLGTSVTPGVEKFRRIGGYPR